MADGAIMADGEPWRIRCGVDVSIEIIGPDGSVDLRPKERAFIASLVIAHPRPVDISTAIAAMWTDEQPATARASFHNHVGRARRLTPGLTASTRRGYGLDQALLELPGSVGVDGTRRLIELDGAIGVDHARQVFEAWSSENEGFAAAVRRRDGGTLLASLHDAVAADPLDERSWWRLMVTQAAAGDHRSVRSSLERARAALADVGLDPSRRLDDIDRLASSGVTDVDRLLADGFGEAPAKRPLLVDPLDDRFGELRESLAHGSDLRIDVVGNDTAERRTLLAAITEEARLAGFSTVVVRCAPDDAVPDAPEMSWPPHRPVLVVIDRAETSSIGAALHDRIRSIVRARISPATPVAIALTTTGGTSPEATTAPDVTTVRVDVMPAPSTSERPSLDEWDADVLRLARLVALIDHPVLAADLASIEPAAGDLAARGTRGALFRHDTRFGHIDIIDPAVADEVLARMTPAERAIAARALLAIGLDDDTPLRAAVRRARLAVLADARIEPHTEALVRQASADVIASLDFAGGATILTRLLDPIERSEGRTHRWCAIALDAGRAAITAGSTSGKRLLFDVVDAGRPIGALDVVGAAVLELCRLGQGSMAGDHDASMRDLIDELSAETTTPALRARLGAAASMVLSFTNEPDRLRAVFDAAEADARSVGDADLLADVLPFTYMSLPLPSDIERRVTNADDLERAATDARRLDGHWEAAQLRLSNQVMAGVGDVRATHDALEAHAARLHERSREWEMCYLRSNLSLIDGDLDAARRHIDESLDFAGDIHPTRVEAAFGANHLAIALAEGTVGSFLDTVRSLADEQPKIGAWTAARALCAADAGESDEASAAFAAWQRLDRDLPIRDHTFTAAALALGESAVRLADADLVGEAIELLAPFADSWTWCGSCTFGPVDLTLARLHAAAGDRASATQSATAALASCAALRAPRYSAAATAVLLDLV